MMHHRPLALTAAFAALAAVPCTARGQSHPPASAVPVPVASAPQVDTVDRIVAVVGSSAITWSDLATAVNQRRAAGLKLPADAEGQREVARSVLNDLVDEEILVQQAKNLKIQVPEAEVTSAVDRQLREVRSHFQSDAEYRSELKNAGFGSPEEYRRTLFDQFRRQELQRRAFAALQKRAKPAGVTDEEVTAAFERARSELQKRPATISFRQIVVAPRPSAAQDARARAKAESLLVELKKGANFEELARRESMDPGTRNQGGDLGWNRRGSGLVPEFEAMMFALRPGELSPVFRTSFGYHIIRVDRVQPSEVKARHILIAPVIDSADVRAALLRADTVAEKWRRGAKFDSLVARYHDPAEEKGVLQPYPVDSLPASYRAALGGVKPDSVADPFPLPTQSGGTKYAVVQVATRTAPGEYSLAEVRENIRSQLSAEKQTREMLDALRRETYVSLRL